ncbi:glycosyl hydrolase family 20, catalytic domain protein [Prevotella sp. DNF00663]|uniref:beta-N-acetylhexosaminidase n=1 Tax=Prevotella sp. DNF00663 TaxID=1384078 RepID=UPI0007863F9A|nr:beta-N-acetylhexosaminidase [Prevotella sp. DNF00663]KXB83989.1 glycosyl hydrolase family 20, catalytic domain protein [Prevotella sp. DNF00663]
MKQFLFYLGLFYCLGLNAQTLLPLPVQQQIGNGTFAVDRHYKIVSNLKGKDSKYIKEQVAMLMGTPKQTTQAQPKGVIVLRLTQGAFRAEGYKLNVGLDTIRIEASTASGIFYAIQTLRQMEQQKHIPCTEITDSPRFAHRGFMLDTSRHFWSKDFIKKQIDALAYFKLNTLHLHLTDCEGWRMQIKKYPQLTDGAAYRTQCSRDQWIDEGRKFCKKDTPGAYGGYYTQKDLKEIVAYARSRYINIVPEIEMPGHSYEVMQVFKDLSCTGQGDGFDLCVGNGHTFKFLTDILQEVMRVFPSKVIHIGGDESTMRYWKKCPKCIGLYNRMNMNDTAQIQGYLISRIDSFLTAHGRRMIGWDEILDGTTLSPQTLVMSWRGEKGGIKASKMGHHVVVCPSKYYYLDHYQDKPETQPKALGGYSPLEKVYSYDPIPAELKGSNVEKYIDGIQGNLWAEYIETPSHVEYMMYPRLLAIAETAWGTKSSYTDFRKRVLHIESYLRSKGYNCFDINHETNTYKAEITK